jgi:hypothetical protein
MLDDPGPESKREAAELAAYADGTLPAHRRAELEQRLARSPRLRALLAEQERALAATAERRERAPGHLAERVRSLRAPARSRRRGVAALALAGAVAAAVLTVVLVLPAGEPSGTSFADAAQLSGRAPHAAAPARANGDGLEYPDWTSDYGWRADGIRLDKIGDRRAVTLFYAHRDRLVGYTIVSRPPLRVPGGERLVRAGHAFRHMRFEGRELLVWERHGRTCILSGRDVPAHTLLELAADDAA